jgi:hypothetical protein
MGELDLMPIIITALVSAIVAGGISAVFGSILTTTALRVQITYLEKECERLDRTITKDVARLDAALNRAHERVDDLERG